MAPEAGVEARPESPQHAHEMNPARWADLGDKLARLTDLARTHDLDTLVLREPPALTWLLGARVNVPQTLDAACLDVIVHVGASGAALTVVTNAIEAPRLRDTELAGLDTACELRWDVVPWWESRDGRLPSGPHVGSDRPLTGSVPLGADLAALRRRLTPKQQGLLTEVCRDTAAAATARSRAR
jgi:antitoxin VapB